MDSIYKQQCEELRQKQDEQDDLKNENARLKASFGALEREEQAIRQRLLALQQRNRGQSALAFLRILDTFSRMLWAADLTCFESLQLSKQN